MNNGVINLEEYIKKLEGFNLPDYNFFPPVDLYMEQVISYVSKCLGDFYNGTNNDIITPFMVNNYVKAKIIKPPIDKKYDKNHISYLLAISLLKSVVPMRDIATFIDLDEKLITNKDSLYDLFREIHDDTLKNIIHKTNIRLDLLSEKFEKNENQDIENLNLSYVALKLYVEAEISKQLADEIMKSISGKLQPKDVMKESRKEHSLGNKKVSNEAKKIGNRK